MELQRIWTDLDGDTGLLDLVGIDGAATEAAALLPSVFDVAGFATDCVAAALLAASELAAARAGGATPAPVDLHRREAAAAFVAERLLTPVGWERPAIWDPVAGDYPTADGWIRLHTNYRWHLEPVLAVLGVPAERDLVAEAVGRWTADELETAVVDAGGCAAAMRPVEQWRAHPAGVASAHERPVRLGEPIPITGGSVPDLAVPADALPLAGIRVLDLTRVIAGPVATGFLSAWGADVVRVDPPAFAEVPALLALTTAGKRCAALDLTDPADREAFEDLVRSAHVVVSGFRPGAMAGLGYDRAGLRSLNPAIVTVTHDAYGWSGPWAGRRGFDSLVQMSTGIADAGRLAAGRAEPTPLPAQALDHGTGFLLAAGACRALARLVRDGVTGDVTGCLVGSANEVLGRPAATAAGAAASPWSDADTEAADTAWGPVRRVPVPGRIGGRSASLAIDAGPLGAAPATWSVSVGQHRG